MPSKAHVRPDSIRLESSSFCQLRCPSCPTTVKAIDEAIGRGFLKLSDFRALIDANPALNTIELSNYGEMFLNPDLLPMMRYAFEKGVSLTARNGVNLNYAREEVLEGLVRYRFRHMSCSIDGASQETYEKYRVRGDFAAVLDNIRKVNAYKEKYDARHPLLTWQFVVFGHNEHEIPLAKQMAEELNMKLHLKLTWDPEFSPIRDPERVRSQMPDHAASREEVRERTGRDYMQRLCHQLWFQPQVNWDGKMLGCCRNFWGDFGGNVYRDGLEATVNNEKMQYARAMLRGNAEPRDDIPCATCEIYLGMKDSSQWLTIGPRTHAERAAEKVRRRLQRMVSRLRRRMTSESSA
jgi:MoaA/NifB/PqqE/SkfB family radical SAM enzyme